MRTTKRFQQTQRPNPLQTSASPVEPRVGKNRLACTAAILAMAALSACSAPAANPPVSDSGESSNVIPASASAAPDLDALQTEFQSVAARISPAVVAISAATTPDDAPAAGRQQSLNPDALGAFLSTTTRMVGAGFFIRSDGFILTNDHVIDGAQQLWVTTDNKTVYPALVVGSDPRADLAILKIPARNCPTLALGANSVRRGQWSLAIGNPFGLGGEGGMCLSVGVVSATDRSLPKLSEKEDRSYYDMIQTTAQINPGSSGGPLLDLHGNVIGINTAVVMPQKYVNGIAFAIPITADLLDTVNKLQRGEAIDYSYLGVTTATATQAERTSAGIAGDIGAKVTRVYPDSPAAEGQLREGDLITAIATQAVASSNAFSQIIGEQSLDRPVQIDFIRNGTQQSISLVLRKRGLPAEPVTRDTQRLRWAGLTVANRRDTAGGVTVCNVEPTSPFAAAGLHEGSVIASIAGQPIGDLLALQSTINDRAIQPGDLSEAATASSSTSEISTASLDR